VAELLGHVVGWRAIASCPDVQDVSRENIGDDFHGVQLLRRVMGVDVATTLAVGADDDARAPERPRRERIDGPVSPAEYRPLTAGGAHPEARGAGRARPGPGGRPRSRCWTTAVAATVLEIEATR
jgi:hypothetical protein